MVNRVLRDDPSKGDMHNRQAVTPKLLFRALCDWEMWPIYLIGLSFLVPTQPPTQYLSLILKANFKRFGKPDDHLLSIIYILTQIQQRSTC